MTSRGDEALRVPQDQEEEAAADLAVRLWDGNVTGSATGEWGGAKLPIINDDDDDDDDDDDVAF